MVVILCIIVTVIAVQSLRKSQARQTRRKDRGVKSDRAEFDRYSASEFDIAENSLSFDHRARREDSFMEDAPLLQQSFMEMGARQQFGQEQEQPFGLSQPVVGLTPPRGLQFPFPQPMRNTASVPPGYAGYPTAF